MQVWGCSLGWNWNYLQPRRGRQCPGNQGDQFCSRDQSGSILSRRADIPRSCNKSQGEDPSWKARIQVGKPWTHGLQVSNKGRAGRGLRADVHRVHEWVWPTANPSGSPHRRDCWPSLTMRLKIPEPILCRGTEDCSRCYISIHRYISLFILSPSFLNRFSVCVFFSVLSFSEYYFFPVSIVSWVRVSSPSATANTVPTSIHHWSRKRWCKISRPPCSESVVAYQPYSAGD